MSTEVLEYQNNLPATFGYVRDGIAGNLDVVQKMIRLVRDSVVLDKGLESLTKDILISKELDAHAQIESIFNALYSFVYGHVKYIQDIAGRTENIKDGRTTLQDGYGDCDDHAILNATMLAMLGYEPKFVIAKYDNDEASNFQHVYTVVYAGGERYVFDTTLPYGELNDEVKTTSKREISIFDYSDEVDGIGGVIQGFKNLFNDTRNNAVSAVSSVSGILPLGIIPAQALAVGLSMFGATTGQSYSLSELSSKVSGKLTDLIIQLDRRKIATQVARQYAKAHMAEFYTAAKQGDGAYAFFEKQLLRKLNYINNYGSIPNSGAVSLNFGLMQILGIGAIGVAAFYLFRKS